MIGYQDAKDIGLMVEWPEPKTQLWESFWRLYCLQRLTVTERQKLFESGYASLTIDGASP